MECVGLRLTIRHSKTDQKGAGQVIAVLSGRVLRPVVRLQAWLAIRGAVPGPLFWRIGPQGWVVEGAMSDRSVARNGASIAKMQEVSRQNCSKTMRARGFYRESMLL